METKRWFLYELKSRLYCNQSFFNQGWLRYKEITNICTGLYLSAVEYIKHALWNDMEQHWSQSKLSFGQKTQQLTTLKQI